MNAKVYYIRDEQRRPILTVAVMPDPDGGVIRATAHCSTLDHCSKRKGRMIALNRLEFYTNKPNYITFSHVPPLRRSSISEHAFTVHWLTAQNGRNRMATTFERKLLKLQECEKEN